MTEDRSEVSRLIGEAIPQNMVWITIMVPAEGEGKGNLELLTNLANDDMCKELINAVADIVNARKPDVDTSYTHE